MENSDLCDPRRTPAAPYPPTRTHPMPKAMVTTIAVVAALLVPSRSAADEPSGDPTPRGTDASETLARAAVEANPGITASRSRIRALQEQVVHAGAWNDPTFSAEYSNMPIDAWVPGHHAMSGIQLTLKQTFYWPGKIRAREDEAEGQVREQQATLAEQKVQLRASVKRAYYRLALTRQLRDVTRAHIRLVGEFIDVIRIKNAAGTASQHQLLQLQVLADKLEDDLGDFDQDEQSLTAAINAALDRPAGVSVPTPERIAVPEPSADVDALVRQAQQVRPLLQRYRATADVERAASRRAAREGYPDITLWAGYRARVKAGTDPGTDFVSFGVAVPLPLFYDSRWGAQRRQHEELALAATQQGAAETDTIRGELGKVLAGWRRSAREARTYRDKLTPEARLALDATFAAYKVDRTDFASLFQAEVQLLDFERTTRVAEASSAMARVDAEALVGSGGQ